MDDVITGVLGFVGAALLVYGWNDLTGKAIYWARHRLEYLYLHDPRFRERVDRWLKK